MKRNRPYKSRYNPHCSTVSAVEQPRTRQAAGDESVDLPGFYYDKEKKRYFRVVPGQNRNNPVTSASIKLKEAADAAIKLSESRRLQTSKPIPKCLTSLQLGSIQSSRFTSALTSVKMLSLTLSGETDFTSASRDVVSSLASADNIEECTYLVGYPQKSIAVGSWAVSSPHGQRGCMIRALSVDENGIKPGAILNVYPMHKLIDLSLTEEDNQVLVTYVCVSARDHSGSPYTIVSTRELAYDAHRGPSHTESRELDLYAAWSCTRDPYNHRTAVGLQGKIEVFPCDSSQSLVLGTAKDKIFSLKFSEAGNLLYGGSNKGNLFCFDLREPRSMNRVFSIHMGRGISYLDLLRSEAVLGSGYDGKLWMVDLKQRRTLHHYEGHNNDGMKLPFSFDPADSMLCSTGQDRVTRVWKLNPGDGQHSPIATILAPEQAHQPWSWYSSSWSRILGRHVVCLTSGIKGYMYT